MARSIRRRSNAKLLDLVQRPPVSLGIFGHDGEQWPTQRFETWKEIEDAVKDATAYWNAQKHPFVWGKRRRHQASRCSDIAVLPKVA